MFLEFVVIFRLEISPSEYVEHILYYKGSHMHLFYIDLRKGQLLFEGCLLYQIKALKFGLEKHLVEIPL